jgi:hypothetical protein
MAKFNFNYTKKKEYKMYGSMVDELINLYGIEVEYLEVSKFNDNVTFQEYESRQLSSDSTTISVKMEEQGEYFDPNSIINSFGISNLESTNIYISYKTLIVLLPDFESSKGFGAMIGNVIIFNSNKILEITDVVPLTPGVSNLFSFNDSKNVIKLTLNTYINSHQDYQNPTYNDTTALDNVFTSLSNDKIAQDTVATSTVYTEYTVDDISGDVTSTIEDKKPIVEKHNVFGDLG